MSKRYVFWRTPTGGPCRRDDDRWAPTELLTEIGTTASVTKEGIRWAGGFEHQIYRTAVRAVVAVLGPDGRELNDSDAWSIVWAAIQSVIKEDKGGSPLVRPVYSRRPTRKHLPTSDVSPVTMC